MKTLKTILGLFVFGIICSGLVTKTFGAVKPVKLSYSVFFPASHQQAVLAGEWAKEIGKRTNGRVKISVFPGETLTAADKCYDGVRKGISDLGMSVLSYTKGKFPLSEVIDLPLGYKSGLAATRLINDYYAKFKPKEFDNVKVMYLHAHGPGLLHTKRPVQTLEDLQGMKIRCTGLSAKVVKALGGIPVTMPIGETYDALKRGVVDGSMAPYEALQGWKWGEAVKSTTESFGCAYSTGFFVVMNKNRWNSLPSDIKKIIAQVNQEWIDKTGRCWDEIDKRGREFTLSRGNRIFPLSNEENLKWAIRVRPVLDEYVTNMEARGLPGKEALKFCQEQLRKSR